MKEDSELPPKVLRVLAGHPPELVVFDQLHDCPYLPLRPARLPLRLPTRHLRADELDGRLSEGDRRQGPVLYRTNCPGCDACVPIRIDVGRFSFGRTHRRILARGKRELTVEFGPPVVDSARVELYNRHKLERGLGDSSSAIDTAGYRAFLVDTCCDSFELRMLLDGRLVGVSVLDRGFSSLSAVYCYFDPDYGDLSLGTFAILRELELCRAWGMRYLYLGLYVEGSEPMAYKARFLPNQQRRQGRWVFVQEPPPPPSSFTQRLPCFGEPVQPLPCVDAFAEENGEPR